MKKIICAVMMAAINAFAFAQSGTNSPYSQYGLGVLSDQTSGFNRGMNGLGLGFHEHNQVNFLNPASYSAIDSLSFIFDVGLSAQVTNIKEGDKKINANNADFEYAVAGFRAFKHLGVSFGIIPYTNVGYEFANKQQYINNTQTTTSTITYSGSGGLHQVYIGTGWEPLKGFSFGANISYLWGSYSRSIVNSFSESSATTLSKYYTADVRSYKFDLGAQYTAKLNKKDQLTFGLTYELGHKLSADPECKVISNESQTSVSDTTTYVVNNGLEIPTTYGFGFMWNHGNKIKLGVDYSLQKWTKIDYPQYSVVTKKVGDVEKEYPQYVLTSGLFKDRHKVTVGADICPGETSRNFFDRIHYRAGVSYATPYVKINGKDGPKELSASLGFGIPIMNGYNNRSLLNISAQWVHVNSKDYITENTFRINIGLTFNERWFAKWKVE